jgi:D-glycerate 3-kinase
VTPSDAVTDAARAWLAQQAPLVLGVCAGQGAGKSTLCAEVKTRLEAEGWRVAVLSLDDLYLSHAARADLARRVHPLFAVRGVPGTHDVGLGLSVLDALRSGGTARLPRFDKGRDDPWPAIDWPEITAPDLILFEGWCVGVPPQAEADLAAPVNALERDEDPDGIWRRAVNDALAGPYHALWSRLDRLVFLAAPDFATVLRWRTEAEHKQTGPRRMSDSEVARFVQSYERLTRHALDVLPQRADLSLRLDADRRLIATTS